MCGGHEKGTTSSWKDKPSRLTGESSREPPNARERSGTADEEGVYD